ncbi:uncharacterized protein LOC120373954 isoform X2 [Mauremys reevesii]|nr:uncharacterized protein LOC120373954 isoform X2 [Mauremys reevesii]
MQLDRECQAIRERDDCIRSARLVAIVQSRGRVDNWNSYSVRSLSSERRRRELAQIGVENQRLVGRLRQQQSEYAREPWEHHWERVELIRNGIARYPRGMRALQMHRDGGVLRWKKEGTRDITGRQEKRSCLNGSKVPEPEGISHVPGGEVRRGFKSWERVLTSSQSDCPVRVGSSFFAAASGGEAGEKKKKRLSGCRRGSEGLMDPPPNCRRSPGRDAPAMDRLPPLSIGHPRHLLPSLVPGAGPVSSAP